MCTALLLALSLLQAEPAPAPPAATTPPTVKADEPSAATGAGGPATTEAQKAEAPPAGAMDAGKVEPAAASEAVSGAPAPRQDAPAADAASSAPEAKAEATGPVPPAGEATTATGASAPLGSDGAAAPAASTGSAAATPTPAVAALAPCPAVEAPKPPGLALIGYSFGVGFPEFGTGSLVVRPLDWLRVSGGLTWNYVGYGLRGGVTLAPIRWYVSPTLNLAAGRYLKMDATKAAKPPAEVRGLVSKVAYQYVDATLGLELGNQRHGMLVLQVGVTRIWLDAPGTATFDATASGGSTSTQTTIDATGVKLKGYGPAASLSWILFL